MQVKFECYGRKKIALVYVLLAIFFVFSVGVTFYTVLSQRWDLLFLCCGGISLLLMVLLWLVNLSADVTLDFEKRIFASKVPFRKEEGWEIGFEEIQRVAILSKEELGVYYKGKFLPKRALCIYLDEHQLKVVPGTRFSTLQLQQVLQKIERRGEDPV